MYTTPVKGLIVGLCFTVLIMLSACEQDNRATLPEQASNADADQSVHVVGDIASGYSEQREACSQRHSERMAFFGETHLHSSFSFDGFADGNRTDPAGAYAFGRGAEIGFPPYDKAGNPSFRKKIDRPLDFMAVTDHAEALGEILQCATPGAGGYDTTVCETVRKGEYAVAFLFAPQISEAEPERIAEICGQDGSGCRASAKTAWALIQRAAEEAYDRSSDCAFTTFVGYEYTSTPDTSNLHRNVIFRNAAVPDYPLSYTDEPYTPKLWEWLQRECIDGIEGCDVLAIPHNPNLSDGRMFARIELGDDAASRRQAGLRNRFEPLVEIFQHKGNSECSNDPLQGVVGQPDELCEFEQVRHLGTSYAVVNPMEKDPQVTDSGVVVDCEGGTGKGGMRNAGCLAAGDFVRGALLIGLQEEGRLGINPFQLGIIAASDAHLSNPGDVAEATWTGAVGYETDLSTRLAEGFMPTNRLGNPGGIAGVWAVENSRDAIFDAMQRRETFGTSGPRIKPRFFGGWQFVESDCARESMVTTGYSKGVPMGGKLTPAVDGGAKPTFIASALRDPIDSAAPLERLQVVKGWLDDAGQARYKIVDLVGKQGDAGANALCGVFRDHEFEPHQSAYYYLRVVEVPTKRWDTLACENAQSAAPPACADAGVRMIQELAWTSPIWYQPDAN